MIRLFTTTQSTLEDVPFEYTVTVASVIQSVEDHTFWSQDIHPTQSKLCYKKEFFFLSLHTDILLYKW